jgi:ssDNA-binding Zn-finger/Zn-ribbon topoisomerase 1
MSGPACPLCGGRMRVRQNRHTGERFWGCASFPACHGTRDLYDNAPGERARNAEDDVLPSERWRARDRRRWRW